MGDWSQRYDQISSDLAKSAEEKADAVYSSLLTQPKTVVILALIVAAWFANVGSDFREQIVDDVEIFLPEGAESTDLLLEVRSEWSTDISLIYIQSKNVDFPGDNSTNIANVDILREISWIEGDDMNANAGGYKHGLDRNKSDRGTEDGVVWILSPAQIIKEANSSAKRFNCALEKYQINKLYF